MPIVAEVAAFLAEIAPPALAADWDNVGLLLGDAKCDATQVVTCLTVTPAVVEEVVASRANLIVCHHPILFRGAKTLSSHSPEGRLLLPLMRKGVAVYSPHTAWDNAAGGVNDGLARRFGLRDVRPLRPKAGPALCKLVAFVPGDDLPRVMDALFAAGAGRIGANDRYTECSFRHPGTGSFHGGPDANPAVGQKGRREEVAEQRLEVVLPEAGVAAAVAALRQAHSYEEPAFDVYPLRPLPAGGEGRVGALAEPCPLAELVRRAKALLPAGAVGFVGDPARPVRRLAVACGAAGEFMGDAIRAGADAFLTGEVRFHDALAAEAAGVALVLPGHHATERPGVEELAGRIAGRFPEAMVWASRAERDPVQYGRPPAAS